MGTQPGGPILKNLPVSVGDTGQIPGPRTNIPYAAKQLSPGDTTAEPVSCDY